MNTTWMDCTVRLCVQRELWGDAPQLVSTGWRPSMAFSSVFDEYLHFNQLLKFKWCLFTALRCKRIWIFIFAFEESAIKKLLGEPRFKVSSNVELKVFEQPNPCESVWNPDLPIRKSNSDSFYGKTLIRIFDFKSNFDEFVWNEISFSFGKHLFGMRMHGTRRCQHRNHRTDTACATAWSRYTLQTKAIEKFY